MSGIFDNDEYGTDHLEEKPRDFVGFEALETNLYLPKIQMAYLVIHESKAQGIAFEFDLGGGKVFKIEQIIKTKERKNYFMTKPRGGGTPKKAPLAGFTVVDDICTITTGKGLKGQTTAEKVVKVYNFDKKEDVPTSVHVLEELLGKEVGLAVIKKLENKSKKEGDKYVATSETITRNDIVKAVYPDNGATVSERAEKKDPTWAASWVKNNKGKTKEKLTYKGDSSGGGSAASTPPAGDRKPLFG